MIVTEVIPYINWKNTGEKYGKFFGSFDDGLFHLRAMTSANVP